VKVLVFITRRLRKKLGEEITKSFKIADSNIELEGIEPIKEKVNFPLI